MTRALPRFFRGLREDTGGVALVEFAFTLPIFVLMCVGGTELANYTTTKMRMSQIALQVADNAARLGTGSPLAAKTISETDINDVFAGAQVDSGGLDISTNGRVILSSLEPTATPNTANTFKIGWQRCYGGKTGHASSYGVAGATGKAYMGPVEKQSKALDDGATMFVEVYYEYKPIISSRWVPLGNFIEVASMAVRDRRNLTTAPNNTAGATIATC